MVVLPTWIVPMVIQFRPIRNRTYYRLAHEIIRAVMHQLATLPGVITVFALCGFLPGGIAWFAVGVIMSMIVAITNAWVLLVEIMR